MAAGHFKPHMLTWARRRCGFSAGDMARKLDHSNLLWTEGVSLLGVNSTETIVGVSDYLTGPDAEISDWA